MATLRESARITAELGIGAYGAIFLSDGIYAALDRVIPGRGKGPLIDLALSAVFFCALKWGTRFDLSLAAAGALTAVRAVQMTYMLGERALLPLPLPPACRKPHPNDIELWRQRYD